MARFLCGLLPVVAVAYADGTVRAATPVGARQTIDSHDLRRHISFLASDTLEGRASGTRGGQAAATYLAGEFRRLGLTPAGGDEDFLQEFGGGSRNVLGLLTGSDPELSREVILLGGHFDHVGYGKAGNSFGPFGQIHNGADDNASGTAAILEVAEACSQLDERPGRSILFALWDGEEAGLLGSQHWAEHPSFELDRVKLALNVDMIGRLRNERVTVYGVRTAAGLRRLASLANHESGLLLDFDWTQRKDSDHWTFCRQRIPYLMFHTGEHEDYHRPSDDVEKLNYEGLERLTRMLFELTRSAASSKHLAGFRPESLQEGTADQRDQTRRDPPPSRLGIDWSPRRETDDPYVITHVVAGSPAAQAGLQSGDRIIRFQGQLPADIEDFAGTVLSSPDRVQLQVERNGEVSAQDMEITLRGAPIRLGVHWSIDSAEPESVIVTGVVPGSPAAKAMIQTGDRLYRPDGTDEQDTDWLRTITAATTEPLHLRIERDGKVSERQIELLPVISRPLPMTEERSAD